MEQIDDRTYLDRPNKKVIRYSGSISKVNNGWSLSFNNKYYKGTYSTSYGTVFEMRKQISDELGQTTTRDATLSELGETPSEELKQYFAGFADGDATIMIRENCRLTCGVYQSSNTGIPSTLQLYKDWFGNEIKVNTREKNKPEYTLQWNGKACVPLLEILVENSIIKVPQAVLALDWLTKNKGNERDEIAQKIKDCKVQSAYQTVEILKERITDAYLAGFFDAEVIRIIAS